MWRVVYIQWSPLPSSTRNSSRDEIANMNFLYDDIVHVLQNTILVHKFCHRSTRLCVRTQVNQIQWNNAIQRPLRRSRSFKVTDFGTNRKLIWDFLLVISSNLYHILHCFRNIAFEKFKIAIIWLPLLRLTPIRRGSPGTMSVKVHRKVRVGQGTKWRRNIAENFNRLSMAHKCYRQTVDRRTDNIIVNVNVR